MRAEGGGLFTEESEVKARWVSYFEWLYQADAPAVKLDVRGVTIPVADPPINCDPPSLVEIQAAVPAVKLDVRGVSIPIADPPINCGPPSFVET